MSASPPIDRAALIAGLFTLTAVIIGNMVLIIASHALFSERGHSELLYGLLRVIGLLSLALPPYVAARAARINPMRHALTLGAAELLLILLMMTQTFSWQGTLQDSVAGRMPLVALGIVVISLAAGLIARMLNRDEDR